MGAIQYYEKTNTVEIESCNGGIVVFSFEDQKTTERFASCILGKRVSVFVAKTDSRDVLEKEPNPVPWKEETK